MKSPFTHFIIAASIAVAVLIAYGFGYVALSRESGTVADLERQITLVTSDMSRVAAARAALSEIAGDEAVLRGYFVPESEAASFIDQLQSFGAAQKTKVSVLSASVRGTPERPTLVLPLTIAGTFDAVMRTVGVIEYAPYDITITSFSIGRDPEKSWQANLTLVVGSLPDQVANPAAKQSNP